MLPNRSFLLGFAQQCGGAAETGMMLEAKRKSWKEEKKKKEIKEKYLAERFTAPVKGFQRRLR